MERGTLQTNDDSPERRSAYVCVARRLRRTPTAARRFVPISVLTAIVYLGVQRMLHLGWTSAFGYEEVVRYWSQPVVRGYSLLPVLHVLNAMFIAYVSIELIISLWCVKPRKLVHVCSGGLTMLVLGLFQISLVQTGQVVEQSRRMVARDLELNQTLRIRCADEPAGPASGPSDGWPKPAWVRVRLGPPGFLSYEMSGVPTVIDGERMLTSYMGQRVRKQGRQGSWVILYLHPALPWRCAVSLCRLARRVGFEKVLVAVGRDQQVELLSDGRPEDLRWSSPLLAEGLLKAEVGILPGATVPIQNLEGRAIDPTPPDAVYSRVGSETVQGEQQAALLRVIRWYRAVYRSRREKQPHRHWPPFALRVRADERLAFANVLPVLQAAAAVRAGQ